MTEITKSIIIYLHCVSLKVPLIVNFYRTCHTHPKQGKQEVDSQDNKKER